MGSDYVSDCIFLCKIIASNNCLYIYINSYLKLLFYIERYNHLHSPNPFHKEGTRFFKNSCNGEMGNLLKMGGEPGMGGLVL